MADAHGENRMSPILRASCPVCQWQRSFPLPKTVREQRAMTGEFVAHAREHVAKGEPIPVPVVETGEAL